MPRNAVGLKKYLRRDGLIGSKTSDNPHTPPSLRDGTLHPVHSHILRVQHPPRERIPAVPKRTEEGEEVGGVLAVDSSRHVLPNDVSGSKLSGKAHEVEGEAGARAASLLHPGPLARDGHILAGRSPGEDVKPSVEKKSDCSICDFLSIV
jgi:hypothetical protein